MSMENPFGSKENAPITKEQVLERLKTEGKSTSSLELLGNWIDQNKEEIRNIEDLKEQVQADLSFEIEKIKLYIESGFFDEAKQEIIGDDGGEEGLLEAPLTSEQRTVVQDLLSEIEAKLKQG